MPSQPFDLLRTEPDWTVLGRFFRGECSPDEVEAIARWEAVTPANAELVAFMRQVWDEAAVEKPVINEDAGWDVVQARIIEAAQPMTASSEIRPLRPFPASVISRRRVWLGRLGAAAAVLAVVVAGSLIGRERQGSVPVAATAREYVTERGQRAELMLADGTRVWLSVASRLRVPDGYGTNARAVELEGEAYFIVEHDAKRPFLVYSRGAVSEDLGTEFGVRAYADDPSTAVTVVSGRVALRSDRTAQDAGVELRHGQMGSIGASGRVVVDDSVDLLTSFGWRDGQLRFDERPLGEALHELERWYDLDIVLEDSSLAHVPLTASIGHRTSDQALAIIAGVLDARYVRDGRRVRLMVERTGT